MRTLRVLLIALCFTACARETEKSPSFTNNASAATDEIKEKVKTGQEVQCPVCGLKFDKGEALASYNFESKDYYFLLKDHFEAFKAAPGDYVKKHQNN